MTAEPQAKRILVIEDERVIGETLVKIFLAAGYDSRHSGSAEEALAMLEDKLWSPEFALIDVSLPGMNGIDLAIRFRADYPKCHIALFSGESSISNLLERAEQDGYQFRILAKPVHPTDLLELICQALSASKESDVKSQDTA